MVDNDNRDEELEELTDEELDSQVDEDAEEAGDAEPTEDDGSSTQDDDDEDPVIPIDYEDEYGNEHNEEVRWSEIQEKYLAYNRMAEAYSQQENMIKEVAPLVNIVKDSELLQTIIYYKSKNHTDDEIKEWIPKHWAKELGDKKPKQYNSVQEELDDLLQQRTKPLVTELEQMKNQRRREQVYATNAQAINTSIAKLGFNPSQLSGAQIKSMEQTFSSLYPGATIDSVQLSQAQTDALARLALANSKPGKTDKEKKKTQVANIINKTKIPKIAPGKGANSATVDKAKNSKPGARDNVSIMQRKRSWETLLSNL